MLRTTLSLECRQNEEIFSVKIIILNTLQIESRNCLLLLIDTAIMKCYKEVSFKCSRIQLNRFYEICAE